VVYGDSESTKRQDGEGRKAVSRLPHCDLLIKGHLEQDKSSTLRELYYISENWDIAKFHEQSESDRLIEDLEIITGLREFLCA
jgi:DNA topoisomerase-6 subunit A